MKAMSDETLNRHLPLSPAVFHLLLALAPGELHGYALMTRMAELSEGLVRVGPGTLYTAIKRLLNSGVIEESDQRPDPDQDDERRRYYRLTDLGRRLLQAELSRYARTVKVARRQGLAIEV